MLTSANTITVFFPQYSGSNFNSKSFYTPTHSVLRQPGIVLCVPSSQYMGTVIFFRINKSMDVRTVCLYVCLSTHLSNYSAVLSKGFPLFIAAYMVPEFLLHLYGICK